LTKLLILLSPDSQITSYHIAPTDTSASTKTTDITAMTVTISPPVLSYSDDTFGIYIFFVPFG
jgi:hypothetical protein